MKKKLNPNPGQTARRGRKRGIALITVLLVLSLMVILVLAILSTSMNATSAASRGANSIRVKDLANTVTSLAISQIRAATTAAPASADGSTPPFTWVSQPGMIRTYSDEGFVAAYPLYSTSTGDITNAEAIASEGARFGSWNNSPERFVDLNAPSIKYNAKGVEAQRVFPILDPRASTIDNVEGFTIDSVNAPGAGVAGDISTGKLLPMPVEWLYMLKDGSLGALSSTGTFSGSSSPSKSNPIVARIAYWVDDDSAKININTASEGVFWDTPRVTTESGRDLGLYQPAGSEASRFPGHPATTCLSSVFFPDHYPDPVLDDEKQLTAEHLEKIYELAPKINWGGTKGGTTSASSDNSEILNFDQDRLYASIDEMVFRMASSSGTRMKNSLFTAGTLPVERIERARGLFTAHSRAPELNVFGRPRMALWPLNENEQGRANQYRSAFDNAIAFAATLGSRNSRRSTGTSKFFLQRGNSQSRTHEFYRRGDGNNKRLYQYIMDQTHQPLPGYGKSLAQKYGASERPYFDYSGAGRETERDLERYDSTRDHAKIGAMIFDYLRGTNLYDANVTDPYTDLDPDGDNFTPFGQTTCFILHDSNLQTGDDQGGGNQDTSWYNFKPKPKGMGRLYTLSEVSMVIFCSAHGTLREAGVPGNGEFPYQTPMKRPVFAGKAGNSADRDQLDIHPLAFSNRAVGQTLRYLQVGMVFELFCPMQGFHMIHPLTTLRMVTGGDGYKGAWGAFDGEDALPNRTNCPDPDKGFTKHTGYKIRSASGFENPISYWGAQPGTTSATGVEPSGPILQTIPRGETNINNIKSELPNSWFGWGGYGGYRILRFADIDISAASRTVDRAALREMTNVSQSSGGRLGGMYSQKPIVVNTPRTTNRGAVPKMRLIAPQDEEGNFIPMQFLIYDADSSNIPIYNVIQTFEIAFPSGEFPVPELAHSSAWEGWGRRYGRAGRDEAADGRVDVITRNDVVRSMIPVHGDYRHIAAKRFVPQTLWAPHPYYNDSEELKAHSLSWSNPSGAEEVRSGSFRSQLGSLGGTFLDDINAKNGGDTRSLIHDPKANAKYGASGNKARRYRADFTFDPKDKETFAPGIDHEKCKIAFDPDLTRDFDNGVGSARDGAYTNKADDGADVSRGITYPYFEVPPASRFDYREATTVDNTYSPNQAIPSPVVFGSLPSLVDANIPWNTLLFRPDMLPLDGKNPRTQDDIIRFGARGVGVEIDYDISTSTPKTIEATGTKPGGRVRHQGIVNTRTKSVEDPQLPPEHLWLDLFWMPTVQPYPLSEPFSTAGKVNLNYQMMPFTYIDRATALHALFKSERMLAIPTEAVDIYKDGADDENRRVDFEADGADPWYKKIDAEETLKAFKKKFDDGEVFMTESEICEMFLYPKSSSPVVYDELGENIRKFWDEHKLTGDNSLERPYGNLYPRLTTKSNVYTVHMTVQVLQKARSTSPQKWEKGDRVVAEYRGSSTIERYIDPNRALGSGDGQMPVYVSQRNSRGATSTLPGLEKFYEFRVVNQRQFAH